MRKRVFRISFYIIGVRVVDRAARNFVKAIINFLKSMIMM